jgi:hypothetical protein
MEHPLEQTPQIEAHLHALQLRGWSHATTVRIAQLRRDAEYGYNTASGVLIEFAKRAVIVTAWHVLEEFQRLRDSGESVIVVCDNMPIVAPQTAFRDEHADIAFLEVPGDSNGLQAVPYRPRLLWPPPSVSVGDLVLLSGFPKRFRQDGDEILHGDLNLLLSVASASEGHFVLQVDYQNLSDAGRVSVPREQLDYGGLSGGPVFLSDCEGSPLVGIISQAGDTLPLWRIASLSQVSTDIGRRSCEPL